MRTLIAFLAATLIASAAAATLAGTAGDGISTVSTC